MSAIWRRKGLFAVPAINEVNESSETESNSKFVSHKIKAVSSVELQSSSVDTSYFITPFIMHLF